MGMRLMAGFGAEHGRVVERLRDGMASGVLSFPLTSFTEDGDLDPESYRAYLAAQLATAPGAVFPACGTGEFSALDEDEYRARVLPIKLAIDAAYLEHATLLGDLELVLRTARHLLPGR